MALIFSMRIFRMTGRNALPDHANAEHEQSGSATAVTEPPDAEHAAALAEHARQVSALSAQGLAMVAADAIGMGCDLLQQAHVLAASPPLSRAQAAEREARLRVQCERDRQETARLAAQREAEERARRQREDAILRDHAGSPAALQIQAFRMMSAREREDSERTAYREPPSSPKPFDIGFSVICDEHGWPTLAELQRVAQSNGWAGAGEAGQRIGECRALGLLVLHKQRTGLVYDYRLRWALS